MAPAASAAEPASAGHRLSIDAGSISIDGRIVGPASVLEWKRLDMVFRELKRLRAGAGSNPPVLALSINGATGATLKSVFEMAAVAGWPKTRVDTDWRPVLLSDLAPLSSQNRANEPPKATLVVVVRAAGVETFVMRNDVAGDDVDAAPVELVPSEKIEADLGRAVSKLAAERVSCVPGILFVEDAADASLVRRTLGVLAKVTLSTPGRPSEFQLRTSEPEPAGEGMRVGAVAGETEIKGRLPPVHIQAIVRANFDQFRKCYEAGLGRDAALRGNVTARFVIGRDGSVTNVANGGSTMPDPEVVKCVLEGFYQLRFEEPVGGIVTVVYPIALEPG